MISVQGGQFVYEGRGEAAIVSLFHQNLHTFSSLRLCVYTLSLPRWMRWCAERATSIKETLEYSMYQNEIVVKTSSSPDVKHLDEQ